MVEDNVSMLISFLDYGELLRLCLDQGLGKWPGNLIINLASLLALSSFFPLYLFLSLHKSVIQTQPKKTYLQMPEG